VTPILRRPRLKTHFVILASLLLVFALGTGVNLWIRTNAQNKLNESFRQDLAVLTTLPVLRRQLRDLSLGSVLTLKKHNPDWRTKLRRSVEEFEAGINELIGSSQSKGLKASLVELERMFVEMTAAQDKSLATGSLEDQTSARELREDVIEQFGAINDGAISQLQRRLASAEETFYLLFLGRVAMELVVTLGLASYLFLAIVRPVLILERKVVEWKLGHTWHAQDAGGIPELRTLSRRFAGMAERLNAQYGREKELNAFKTKLVSLVSHEFGNALAVMANATFLLQEKSTAEQRRENAELFQMISANISSLNQAVNNLLNLSRVEAGKLAMNLGETSVEEMLADRVRQFSILAERKRLRVEPELPPGLPPVRADAGSMALVVSNLLNNAIKYTPERGRIAYGAELDPKDPAHVRVFIADNGIGISKQDQQRILAGFYRAESGRTMSNKGFGIGLSLANQILEAHGSRLELESSPGKGSRFSFLLPVWNGAAAGA
jgi:signal transduction histidine kinase